MYIANRSEMLNVVRKRRRERSKSDDEYYLLLCMLSYVAMPVFWCDLVDAYRPYLLCHLLTRNGLSKT